MKKISVFAGMCLLFVLYSCNVKTKAAIKFDADYYSTATVAQIVSTSTTDTIEAQQITTNINTLTSNNKTSKDLISSVKCSAIGLDIDNSDQTFSCLSDARVFIAKPDGDYVEIGNKHSISNNGKHLDCDIDDTDVKQIITQDVVKVRIIKTNSQTTTTSFTLKIHFSFHFEATGTGGVNI